MFGKKNKTIFDYVMSWEPKHQIEDLIRPTYLENTASVDHRELEKDVHEYWDLLHPMIQDFINSYALTYQKMSKEMSEFREQLDGYRRKLTLEQQNVQDLSDELREVKATLHEEAVMRRDLDERLKDESTALQARFDDEKRALEIIANTKLGDGLSMEKVMSELRKNTASSDEVVRLQNKINELEIKIKMEREENEKIQMELSTSFMEKITRYDEMIENLKSRLGEE